MSISSDEFEKSKKAFEELKKSMSQGLKIQKKMEEGLTDYAKTIRNIGEQQKNINHLESELEVTVSKIKALKEEIAKKEEENKDKIERWQKLYESGSERTKKIAEKNLKILSAQTNELKTQLHLQQGIKKSADSYLIVQKENLEIAKKSAREASLLLASMRSLGKLGNFAKTWGFDKLKAWGVFEMDKEIRNAARSMNVGKKDFEGFSKNISKAAQSTVVWGVNAKELAVMQRGYSEAIGRSVELTEDGHKAMALMAEGTGLGTEFAVQMATEMDKFGASVKTSKDLIAGTIRQAGRVGVNGAAASKKLVSLLKVSQTYVFKGGQEGLKKMASDAERLKLDIEGAAGFAEKVMRPEGAVETAALLTTMGGEFAKLGDPFQLMFKARNDFAGFTKDLGKASAEFVEFNNQTGSFDIKGGLARDRMLEISKITGVQMDKLQEMAVAEKKLQMIQGKAPAGITSQEDLDLISSLAEVGKNGEIMIKMHGKDPLRIEQMNASMLKDYKRKQQDLEETAEQARTFDEVIGDFFMSLKQTLLPFANSLKVGLGEPLQRLMKKWDEKGFYNKLEEWGKAAAGLVIGLGKFVLGVVEFIAEWPKLSAALILLFGPAKWFANGLALRAGFNSLGGFGGGAGGAGGGYGTLGGLIGPAQKMSTLGTMGANFKGTAKSGGAIGGGLLAGGFAGYNEYQENKAMGMSGGENAFRTTAKGAGAGLGAWGGAAAGAAIGSVVPIIGTAIGGLIGAALGAWGGGALGEFAGDAKYGNEKKYNDALIASDGNNNGGLGTRIQFNPHDKFMSFDDVMIAGTNAGANNSLYEDLTGGGSNNTTTEVSGEITQNIKIDVAVPNASDFTRMIANHIINDRESLRIINVGLNSDSNAQKKGGKGTGKPMKPLR